MPKKTTHRSSIEYRVLSTAFVNQVDIPNKGTNRFAGGSVHDCFNYCSKTKGNLHNAAVNDLSDGLAKALHQTKTPKS